MNSAGIQSDFSLNSVRVQRSCTQEYMSGCPLDFFPRLEQPADSWPWEETARSAKNKSTSTG